MYRYEAFRIIDDVGFFVFCNAPIGRTLGGNQ